jgi:putative transposase
VRKAFKYRLYPNREQEKKLFWILSRCRELYNSALQERRDAYELGVKRHPNYYDQATRRELTKAHAVSYYDQKKALPEIKDLRPEYQEIHSQVLQDVLLRLKRAFDAFFRRVAEGQTPGYPRFQGLTRFNSFMYPQADAFELGTKHVILSKIGQLRVKVHRPVEGTAKTCMIKYDAGQWYIIVSCECDEPSPLPICQSEVGIDLGVTHLAALSDGTFIDHPRCFRKAEKKLQTLQQALSKKKKGSHRRKKAVKQVAKAHCKIRNQRADFHHKTSRYLVNQHQVIALEDLQITNLVKAPKPKQDELTGDSLPNGAAAKAGLTKSILDAGWGHFTHMITFKAAWAGRIVVFVNPRNTSQVCHHCGMIVHKELSDRWHSCPCGEELDRDTNSAKLILTLGKNHLSGGKRPTLETA